MSLADELLADFEDDEPIAEDDFADDAAVEEVGDETQSNQRTDNGKIDPKSVWNIAKLADSPELEDLLLEIEFYKRLSSEGTSSEGSIEADPEYQLIVRANALMSEIDTEIGIIHKFARDIYNKRFPELESLIANPLDYLRTARVLDNDILSNAKLSETLGQFLSGATVMILHVSASTTQGSPLDEKELAYAMEACDAGMKLGDTQRKVHAYIESRMSKIAPNLSHIVGTSIAAKLIGTAGGLLKLSEMPACNIQVLGAQKKTLSGFSSTAILPHTGFIYHCDLVQKIPGDFRKKLARVIGGKCALAARVDAFKESPDGSQGQEFLERIDHIIDKLLEPPPVKAKKPLPVPLDGISKRRGGRRARKKKERLGLTDLRKASNRMNFGEIEEESFQEDMGFSLGTLAKSSGGFGIRQAQIDAKTKAKISKSLQTKINKANQSYGGNTTVKRAVAGTSSIVAFTPMQGLEIVNPNATKPAPDDTEAKYFAPHSGFMSPVF